MIQAGVAADASGWHGGEDNEWAKFNQTQLLRSAKSISVGV